ncbi:hypothetical protein ECEC1848_5733, partial [Escherichia coli EC1848]
MTLRCLLNPW